MGAEAEIKVAEAMLQQARGIGQSTDPEVRIAAAKFEVKLTKQLASLSRKRKRGNGHAAPQKD